MPDRETWKRYVRAVDPFRELQGTEVDTLYEERPQSVWRRLWDDLSITMSPESVKILVAGSRGSGKTTELIRLEREACSEFVVVRMDIGPLHADGSGTLPILAGLAAALELANRSWRGDEASGTGTSSLRDVMHRFGVTGEALDALLSGLGAVVTVVAPTPEGAAVGGALVAAGKSASAVGRVSLGLQQLSRGEKLAGPVTEANDKEANALVDALNSALQELGSLSGRPPLLLIDGLDKKVRLDDVYTALQDAHLLLAVQAPLVFTGPAHLRTDPRFVAGNVSGFQTEILHNIAVKTHGEDGQVVKYQVGVDALISLAVKRLRGAELADDFVAHDALESLAHHSSGYVRDFLRLLDEAGKACRARAGDAITEADAVVAIREMRHGLQSALNEEDLGLLAHVLDAERLPSGERADALFYENLIVCYRNDDLWYRPHEVLVPFVERQLERD